MESPARKNWPDLPGLEEGYTDEFGDIHSDVYRAAGKLFPSAEKYARDKLGDQAQTHRLLLKASALVTRKMTVHTEGFLNLGSYLFVTFKHLVLAELEKSNNHQKHERELFFQTAEATDDLDRKILIQQIIQRMDGWTRTVFDLLALGYRNEEIAQMMEMPANRLRARYSKNLKKIGREIEDSNNREMKK